MSGRHARSLRRPFGNANAHHATQWRELDRVLQKIVEELHDRDVVATQQQPMLRLCEPEMERALRPRRVCPVNAPPHQLRHVEHLEVRLQTRLDAREIQQLGEHGGQAASAVEIELEQLSLLGRERSGKPVEQHADRFLHAGEWRLEIVRDLRDEVTLHSIQLIQSLGHRVEVARDLRELVVADAFQSIAEPTGRHLPRALGKAAQGFDDGAHEECREQQAENEHAHTCQPREPLCLARGLFGCLHLCAHGILRRNRQAARPVAGPVERRLQLCDCRTTCLRRCIRNRRQ
ncbi:hypothetical protein BH11GEM2_BH11GEM2_18940 [soil metagenome]